MVRWKGFDLFLLLFVCINWVEYWSNMFWMYKFSYDEDCYGIIILGDGFGSCFELFISCKFIVVGS